MNLLQVIWVAFYLSQAFWKRCVKSVRRKKFVLIFDEVMTGFRLAAGGAQEKLKIDADLVTFGKVIGGGMPVGAFGGKKEIMSHIAPVGKVYQAGTLSGNPIAMIAGYTLLETLKNNPSIYVELEEKGAYLEDGLHNSFEKVRTAICDQQVGIDDQCSFQ